MPDALPYSVGICYVIFFGFLNTHQRHASHFQGASHRFYVALNISLISGVIVGLGLLVYYGYVTSWYWPIALFFGGSIISGIIFGILDGIIGQGVISLIGFLGWPASAYFFFQAINTIYE